MRIRETLEQLWLRDTQRFYIELTHLALHVNGIQEQDNSSSSGSGTGGGSSSGSGDGSGGGGSISWRLAIDG